MGTTQCTCQTPSTDPRGAFPYPLHRPVPLSLFLSLRHTSFLACSSAISDILPLVLGFNFRDSITSIESTPILVRLVPFCIILSSASSPLCRAASNSKIHFWVSSPWHHLTWSFYSICHRSPWLLSTLPRNHQHAADSGFQFPYSHIPRLRSCHGPGQRFSGIVRESAFQGRHQRRRNGSCHYHSCRWSPRIARLTTSILEAGTQAAPGLRQACHSDRS